MKQYGKLNLRNCDCMELMRDYPDNHFDLAIVDPPYGIKGLSANEKRDPNSIIDNLKFDMEPKWKAHLKLEKCGKCGRRFYNQKKGF